MRHLQNRLIQNIKGQKLIGQKCPLTHLFMQKNYNDNNWKKRHFAKFNANNGLSDDFYCYIDSKTSWSSEEVDIYSWSQCKIAEGVDCNE